MSQIALVQSLYASFGRGDIATLLSNLHADIDWESYGPAGSYPTLGQRAGKSEVERFFAASVATQDFSDFSPREFYEVGDKVFVLGSYAGKIKKTGHAFACEWVHVFTVKDGKVSRFREYTDTAQFVTGYRG